MNFSLPLSLSLRRFCQYSKYSGKSCKNTSLLFNNIAIGNSRIYPALLEVGLRYTHNSTNNATQSNINKSWVESNLIPASIKPYLYLARVDKPVGTYLLMWPCLWFRT